MEAGSIPPWDRPSGPKSRQARCGHARTRRRSPRPRSATRRPRCLRQRLQRPRWSSASRRPASLLRPPHPSAPTVQAICALVAQGPEAVLQALKSGKLKYKMPREMRTQQAPRSAIGRTVRPIRMTLDKAEAMRAQYAALLADHAAQGCPAGRRRHLCHVEAPDQSIFSTTAAGSVRQPKGPNHHGPVRESFPYRFSSLPERNPQ